MADRPLLRGPAPAVVAGAAGVAGIAAVTAVGAIPIAIGAVGAAAWFGLASGAAMLRSRRHPEVVPAPPDPLPDTSNDAELLANLHGLEGQIEGKVPPVVTARVSRIVEVVAETIPRLDQLGMGSAQAHSVLRTATSYLPEALTAYMRLPRRFADERPVSGRKTSLVVLCDQLDLLAAKMDDVYDAVCRADADALVAHGQFLAEKFGSGSLALDPAQR